MKLFKTKLESKIPLFSLILSVVVAWLMFPPVNGFPMVAFFILFSGLSTLVYFVRKEKSRFDTLLYACILLLSFFTIYRANGFLQFLDLLFIIFFGSLLVRPIIHDYILPDLLLSPLVVIRNAFISKNIFPYKFDLPAKSKETNYIRSYLPTIIITGLILVITIPLLASANPFFNSLMQNVLKTFSLEWLFRYIFADQFSVYIIRVILLVFLAYFIPRILTISVEGIQRIEIKQFFTVNYLIPKVAMAGLLIVFFITQLQLYFATPQSLQNMGYTNSRLTNEVFAQVTIVAFIVFVLAFLDKSKKAWNIRLTYFLITEAFFLILIAFKSVYDYTYLWGFTQKRLWGYTSMAWLTGVLVAFIYHYREETSNLRFIKQVITYTMGVLLFVNILNFDYLIYRYAKASTSAGIDYFYLAGLSPDAGHYKDELTKLMPEIEKSSSFDYRKISAAYIILNRIDFLRYKYGNLRDVNSFNISEYQEYLATKDVDVQGYRKYLSDTQQRIAPVNQPYLQRLNRR